MSARAGAAAGRRTSFGATGAPRSLLVGTMVCRLWLSCGASAALLLLLAAPAAAQAPSDPLAPFLHGLADSTDAYFGKNAVAFDTTGVDSLIRAGGKAGQGRGRSGAWTTVAPSMGYHRATGEAAGLRWRMFFASGSSMEAASGYEFADHRGRYRLALERALLGRDRPARGGRLLLNADYARETIPFAPEHAMGIESVPAAFFTGRDRQDVYESRGGGLRLRWASPALLAEIGWRSARDQAMPLATRFSLFGRRGDVVAVTAARTGGYRQGLARLAYAFPGGPHLDAEGRFSDRDRWRARLAAAQSLAPGALALHLQAEAGLAARHGPPQDRLELGGPLAIPSLGFGDVSGNHLLLGKCELLHAIDLLRSWHVPHPMFLILHPAIFAQGAAAWTGADNLGRAPARPDWRGSAGIALVHLPGFPSEESYLRLQMAWPVGRESGVARFSVAFSPWRDLTPDR